MILLHAIVALLRLIIIMALLVACYLYYLIGKLWHRRDPLRWGMTMQQRYVRIVLLVFQARIRRIGDLPKATGLIVSNHRSLLDPLIILKHTEARTVAKAEVRGYPILGKAALDTGTIFVKREDKSSRRQVKDAIIEHLREGWSILIFPEGTTSDQPTTKPFFKGSFGRAVAADVPVIPIALVYHHRRYHWEDGGLVRYYLQAFGLHRPKVTISFGPPIRATDGDLSAAQAQAWIAAEITRLAPTGGDA